MAILIVDAKERSKHTKLSQSVHFAIQGNDCFLKPKKTILNCPNWGLSDYHLEAFRAWHLLSVLWELVA